MEEVILKYEPGSVIKSKEDDQLYVITQVAFSDNPKEEPKFLIQPFFVCTEKDLNDKFEVPENIFGNENSEDKSKKPVKYERGDIIINKNDKTHTIYLVSFVEFVTLDENDYEIYKYKLVGLNNDSFAIIQSDDEDFSDYELYDEPNTFEKEFDFN